MLFKGPIQGLINTNSVFAKFESETLRAKMLFVKVVYVLMQFLLLALGVWKVNAMGLLPYVLDVSVLWGVSANIRVDRTTRSDWLAWESERQPLETVHFAFG